ncbi:MAG TPA: MlaD family protein [Thermoanaerobaculia bacterium]|jgi:phospholipid/cholesterol/gamma-HCH transport system substrate-binding protein|nr:MlaD family protein [Thermoanaerobaculia bacterium]
MSSLIKVGIFATVCLVIVAVLIWKIEDLNPFAAKGQRIDAVFPSVAGLDDKATVRVAGVRVGRVDGVGLQDTHARITLALEKPLPLTVGTTARIANLGLLGEKYVELVPGPPGAPPLPENAVLIGTSPPTFDDAMAKLEDIGTSIQQVTGAISGENINRLVSDIQLTSAEIRALVAENRANVASTVRNFDQMSAILARELPRLADQISRSLDQISDLVQENRGNVSASMGNIRELTSKLQTSADNLNAISSKIASGQGTIGKLINDDQAYNEVLSTLDSIQGGVITLSNTVGAFNKFKIDLDMQGYYLPDADGSQTSFRLDIDPQDNKHLYRAGLVSSPFGKRREKTETVTVTGPDGIPVTTTTQKITQDRTYAATGLFGFKAPGDVRLWAGLIENTGGAQVEYPLPLLDRKLWLSFEAFDFNRPQDLQPHLRLLGRYQFHPNLYLVGGYDDFLEDDSLFLGGGIRWTDENIKSLLGLVGGAIR